MMAFYVLPYYRFIMIAPYRFNFQNCGVFWYPKNIFGNTKTFKYKRVTVLLAKTVRPVIGGLHQSEYLYCPEQFISGQWRS